MLDALARLARRRRLAVPILALIASVVGAVVGGPVVGQLQGGGFDDPRSESSRALARAEGLLGYRSQGALESTQPVLLFAIAFGLSTDDGVFLLLRIVEAHRAGLDTREAVAAGLERTGRIITAAALLGDWNWWAPRPLRLLQHRLAPGTEPP